MSDDLDFFRGDELVDDPYPYFDWLRERGPIHREPRYGTYMVTGYEEACAIYTDADTFSSCNSVTGPFPGFPVPLEGRDEPEVRDLVEKHRHELPFSDQIITMDPPEHRDHRHLLMRQLTPKRLKENEDFVWRLADRQIDEIVARGGCEFIGDYANPFTLFVIADLLGVPEGEHEEFREALARRPHGDAVGSTSDTMSQNPLAWLYDRFSGYVEDRRRQPRDDVLTALATTTFPNGDLPEVIDVVRVAANVFAAGQETTVRLLGTALQRIGDDPELQQLLREQGELVPDFVEETLRTESPVKGDFRLTRRATTLGGVEIPAGAAPGYLEQEFRVLGAPFEDRGPRTDDAIRAVRASFGRSMPSYEGPYYRFENMIVDPCGVQQDVPLWIGGRTPRSLRRAVALGDGWCPFAISPRRAAQWLAAARDTEAWEQRDKPLEVVLGTHRPLDPSGAPREALDMVKENGDAGITTVPLRFVHHSLAHYLEQLEAMRNLIASSGLRGW